MILEYTQLLAIHGGCHSPSLWEISTEEWIERTRSSHTLWRKNWIEYPSWKRCIIQKQVSEILCSN